MEKEIGYGCILLGKLPDHAIVAVSEGRVDIPVTCAFAAPASPHTSKDQSKASARRSAFVAPCVFLRTQEIYR